MKLRIFWILCLIILTQTTYADGNSVGNGGDAVAAEFALKARAALRRISARNRNILQMKTDIAKADHAGLRAAIRLK